MQNFTFSNKTKIIFGKETQLQVGKEVKQYGSKVLLHYGGGSIKKTGLYDQIVNSLKAEGIEYIELDGVLPNPRLSLVHKGIDLCRKHEVNFILAVGGGSVIDSAKAIAAGVYYDGDVWDFFVNKGHATNGVPLGVVLTIAAAGSESSAGTVITNEEGWYKRSASSEYMRPTFSILNPELTYTLPKYQTMSGVADMLSHVFERYFVHEKNVDLTDRLCEATMKTIINQARILNENPKNYEARAEIMWAGTLAHNGLLNTGRGGDWATHMIEHEVSGIYDVTHGAGLAALFPSWMRYVMDKNLDRFVQFAIRVWDVDLAFDDREKIALEGIRRLENFFKEIELPIRLHELDVPDQRFMEMAEKSVQFGPIGHLKQLNKEDVYNILKLAK